MIEAFRLIRFRGFEDTGWIELRPLTLFFGHNSSGKSSLLAGLLMLRQSVLNPDRSTPFLFTSNLGIDLGSYRDVVFGHQDDLLKPLAFEVRLRLDNAYTGLGLSITQLIVRVEIGYHRNEHRPVLKSFGILDIGRATLIELVRKRSVRSSGSIWRLASDAFKKRELPNPAELEWINFFPLLPQQSEAYKSVREVLETVAEQFRNDLAAVTYIGPLRTEPERVYYFTGETVDEVGRRGENTYKMLAAARYQGRRDEIDQKLNRWLSQLGYQLHLRVFGDTPVIQIEMQELEHGNGSERYNLKDMGFGLSQVLPLIVQCYTSIGPRTILLEQPELHLHPRAQADLGDLLIDALLEGHKFVIETHSEHLLLRLRRRIAETTVRSSTEEERRLEPDQLGAYFVERQAGRSVISPVGVNELGQIPQPPDGFQRFFSDDYEEVMAISKAVAISHKQEAAG
jgi:predicted ATPase